MAKLKKGSFPGIARQAKQSQSEGAITENIEILTGQRGNGENRALLVKDLVNLDDMKRRALINNASGGGAGNLPIGGGGIERPHAPVNLTGTGGFTFIALTWDHPTYRGHAYAEIWRSETDSFSSATLIATEVTDIFSDSVNMGTGYYYWVRFVNVADMKGPTQGAKGLYVETQKSAEQILGEIGGLIEKSHLGEFLTSEIDAIPDLDSIPGIYTIPDLTLELNNAKTDISGYKQRVESIDAQTDSLARQLIDAALIGDKNWQSNTQKLVSLETVVGDVKAKIDNEFFTMAEATEAIAAATQTIRAEIEDSGISLSGNISETYFTKAGTNEAIAAYGQTLKSQIEDPNGTSIGAALKTDYYTKVSTDEAISEATTAMASTVTTDVNAAVDAKLTQSYYTKSGVDGAISESATLIISEIQNPDGEGLGSILFNNYQTKTDAKETEANLVQQLNSAYTESSQAVIENALANDVSEERKTAAEADIVLQQKTLANEQEAIANSLFTMRADLGDSSAKLSQLQQTISTSTSAVSRNLLELSSNIGETNREVERVNADLQINYSTTATTEKAISDATTQLKSTIENPEGNSVGADLYNNYSTTATMNSAISQASQLLKSQIEDPNGASVGGDLKVVTSDLQTRYYTKTLVDQAISSATTQLKSTIENPSGSSVGADLYNNYYTKSAANAAISSASTLLKSQIENPNGDSVGSDIKAVSADLQNNYYTKVSTDQAISSATTQLKSAIENPSGNSVGADLYKNYYTKAGADSAISTASQILKSQIEDANGNSIGASLQTLSQTVASNKGDFSALWGVKTSVNGLQSSLGLVNDGVDPIFAVKGAKFAIITDQNPTNLTPVFAVSGGKTVINTAIIDQAFIKSLVTDDLLSNRVLVGSRFTSPSINYNPANGARSNNFSIDPGGNMLAKSATLESVTIKDNNGNIVMSSTGAIPSSKVTGLGSLATKNGLSYDEVSGKPSFGAFAFLSSLGYNDLSGKPTLGSLAAKNSLAYNEVTGRPALGSLAYLNSLAYNSITGKPSLGPFAGLSKILSSNVTTYIANGAIGSAQIDQAYINQLFGQNASFYGTVYANNIEGDVTDSRVKAGNQVSNFNEVTIATFTVSALPFARTVVFSGLLAEMPATSGQFPGSAFGTSKSRVTWSGGATTEVRTNLDAGVTSSTLVEPIVVTLPANTSRTYYVKGKVEGAGSMKLGGSVLCQAFKAGSTIS